jgi:hypothetical protein
MHKGEKNYACLSWKRFTQRSSVPIRVDFKLFHSANAHVTGLSSICDWTMYFLVKVGLNSKSASTIADACVYNTWNITKRETLYIEL